LATTGFFSSIFSSKKGPVKINIKDLKKKVEANPKDLKSILKLGDFYAAKNNKKNAIAYYRKAADICIQDGFLNKGIAIFKKILTLDKKNSEIHQQLAELYMRQNLFAEATLQLEKALEEDPNNEKIKETLKKLSGYTEKQQSIIEALRADKEVQLTSRSTSQEEILSEAKRQIRQQLSNEDFLEHFDLGVAYMEMELHESAIEEFEIALNSPKFFKESVRLIFENFSAMDRAHDAILYFNNLLKRPNFTDTQKAVIRFYIAQAYEESLETEKALQIYEDLLRTGYPDPEVLQENIKRLKASGHQE
jgi:tetratricopeptide (TPR) repeat protein